LTKVTISQIARMSDLSEATVSRVLNNKQNVSSATRQIVLDIVDQVGYIHTPRIRPDDHQLKNIVLCMGLFDSNVNLATLLANGYYGEIVESIQAECQSLNMNLMLMTIGPDMNSLVDIERNIDDGNLDAILLIRVMNPEAVQRIVDLDIPIVLLGNYFPWIQIDSVNSESFSGMLGAMYHLLENGHRKIAFIDGHLPPFNDHWVTVRKLAYQHMLEQYQIPFDSDLVVYGNLSAEGGRKAMEQLLARDVSFTAVLASNDQSAIGASQALQDANLSIPDDVSLIGHDNIKDQFLTQLGLTTVDVAKHDMGRIALDLLQARIQKPDRPIQHILTAESLIFRESVKNIDGNQLKTVGSKILPYRR
jgi:LacI family transcriptional regulator